MVVSFYVSYVNIRMNVSVSSPLVSFSEAVIPLRAYCTQVIRDVKLKIECDTRPTCAKHLLNLGANRSF